MTKKNIITFVVGVFLSITLVTANQFKTLRSVETFMHSGSWEQVSEGKDAIALEFSSNHTLSDGKAVKLGSKTYRFWSVAKHPTLEGSFVLRVHSKKTAGWYTFSWNSKAQSWTSKHWPKVKIKKK